jgi:hypothetical protein
MREAFLVVLRGRRASGDLVPVREEGVDPAARVAEEQCEVVDDAEDELLSAPSMPHNCGCRRGGGFDPHLLHLRPITAVNDAGVGWKPHVTTPCTREKGRRENT